MAPYPRAWDDWEVDHTPQPGRDTDPSEAEQVFQFFQTFVGWIVVFTILGLIPLILCGLVAHLYTIFVGDPDLNPDLNHFFWRSWSTLARTPQRLKLMFTKFARWMCRVKPERPITPQPQESGVELGSVTWHQLNEMSLPLPDDTSTRPPENASAPRQREGSSNYPRPDSGLYTLREGDSASSTNTAVEEPDLFMEEQPEIIAEHSRRFMVMTYPGNAARAASTETIMPRAM